MRHIVVVLVLEVEQAVFFFLNSFKLSLSFLKIQLKGLSTLHCIMYRQFAGYVVCDICKLGLILKKFLLVINIICIYYLLTYSMEQSPS